MREREGGGHSYDCDVEPTALRPDSWSRQNEVMGAERWRRGPRCRQMSISDWLASQDLYSQPWCEVQSCDLGLVIYSRTKWVVTKPSQVWLGYGEQRNCGQMAGLGGFHTPAGSLPHLTGVPGSAPLRPRLLPALPLGASASG